MTPMPNAANPNAIFGEALARTPAPEPLDVVLGRMAQTQGQALQNRQTAISLAGDQALRDAIRNNTRAIPVGAPPSGFPAEPARFLTVMAIRLEIRAGTPPRPAPRRRHRFPT